MITNQYNETNEKGLHKWDNRPKFRHDCAITNFIKLIYHTKRYFFIREIKKFMKKNSDQGKFHLLDFGSGHGGLSIDIATTFRHMVEVTGYEISKTAYDISLQHNGEFHEPVHFQLDTDQDFKKFYPRNKFDIIISCDVFGHVPDLQASLCDLFDVLKPGGALLAFSETETGKSLKVITYLQKNGFSMDGSAVEHISLYTNRTLRTMLGEAGFTGISIHPFDPIRFPFYPKRYLKALRSGNKVLFVIALFFSLFQNLATEIIYNQINFWLSKLYRSDTTTAGCFIKAYKKPVA